MSTESVLPPLVVFPMFPLGSVLFPHAYLPLRIFEPRYCTMIEDVTAPTAAREFGVVLIERGSEVGGGEVRHTVGTVARIVEVEPQADGGWLVIAVGVRRITVEHWLPDNPYPQAEVVNSDDPGPDTAAHPGELELNPAMATLRRVLAMCAELDEPGAPATIELDTDATIRLWQMCAIAPVGPVDDLRLLRAPTGAARLEVLIELLDDEAMVLSHRLSAG